MRQYTIRNVLFGYGTAIALLFSGCGTTCPHVKATRCNGQVVETCGASKKWMRTMDCAQVKPLKPGAPLNWTCRETPDGHTCVADPGSTK
jgi:hypothetical protein